MMSGESSSDDDMFTDNPCRYMYEPEYTEEELRARRPQRVTSTHLPQAQVAPTEAACQGDHRTTRSTENDRTADAEWCTCGKCTVMSTRVECVCCHESARALAVIAEVDSSGNLSIYLSETARSKPCYNHCLDSRP